MKSRWLHRILGGFAAIILGVLVTLALSHAGLLNGTQSSVFADDEGCPTGMHGCADNVHCCPAGAAYDCLADDCDSSKSHTCYPPTDDNLHYLQQCCSQNIACGQ